MSHTKEDLQKLSEAIARTDWRSDAEKVEHLTRRWQETKAALSVAQAEHLQSEIALYEAVKDQIPAKGTLTLPTGMKIVTGFKESWDQEKLNRIHQEWDGALKFPFKGEWKADGKAISYLRDNAPETYRKLSEALTLTDKKPAFSMKDYV